MIATKWENSFSREKGSSLWGEDTTSGLSISLLPSLAALEGPVEIDDDGKGFEKCGHFLFCNSLKLGLRRMKEASVDTMKVMEKITATTPLEPQCDLCIEGKNEDHPLCGSSELTCLSVDTSVGLTTVRTVEINGEGDVKTQMRMDGDFLTIEGHRKRGVVRMIGKGQIVSNVFGNPDTLLLSFVSVDS
ncbi:hypothetical protein BLNAU_18383 [Blattamonas nauphoetae]|nr:hypothetical protein BLNAU_18383 [Blattamonas nauphoetae]